MSVEEIKQFFELSTIHGLYYISTVRRWSRLFWILTVIGGFSGAGYLIYESFDNWSQSPIKTTIETLPLSQLTFPNVTVCPPQASFLNLNYHIVQSKEITLDNNKREKLIEDSFKIYQEQYFNGIMTYFRKVDDPDRFYNWYQGYTRINYPSYSWNNLATSL